jgi:RNase P subunit RPR2
MAKDIEGYCVKCKAKRIMKEPQQVQMKKKGGGTRPAAKGTCPECGTTMFRIGGIVED